ncbi:phosphoribosyltransferase [Glaciimonas immobilis]|uniref:Phosphoribosyltransferase domain-containing protein n=1 Tax=Glaciimonas immobilis TaxID=728004 RepID=A0A840RRN1_9BURK|nr:phosphoribosyltransferase [Glaciimonas immobilis]KAF3999934.1 phosphoribosyltransferase [Glaciimonas immobilis]MBB5200435.1 hypothetical protein [Glaciimonas immobilis]
MIDILASLAVYRRVTSDSYCLAGNTKDYNDGNSMVKPFRFAWDGFPDVFIHASEETVKKHPAYLAAKTGDVESAAELVLETLDDQVVLSMLEHFGSGSESPILISVHAEEAIGVNAIPEIMADILSYSLEWEIERLVVQANVVNHTGASEFSRLARQAVFEGTIQPGNAYVIVDDFIGQGGTVANLRGHILAQGGNVIGQPR